MGKVLGWFLFLIAIGVGRLYIINSARYGDIDELVTVIIIAIILLSLFGWYKLAIAKRK